MTIRISSVITSSQDVTHPITRYILTGINHSSHIEQWSSIDGFFKKNLGWYLHNILNHTIIDSYDNVKMAVEETIDNSIKVNYFICTNLNGPFSRLIAGRLMVNV